MTVQEKMLKLEAQIADVEDRLADAEYDSVIDRLEARLEKLQTMYDALEDTLDRDDVCKGCPALDCTHCRCWI